MNSDQGSHFTCPAYLELLDSCGVKISMDGKGQALDNVRTERFFRSLKYDDLYIKEYETPKEMIAGIRKNTKAEVVLVTAVWLDDPGSYDFVEKSFYGKLEELAGKFGLPVARVHERWRRQVLSGAVDFQALVQFDGVHPTVEGYRLMAEAVMEVFSE
jgi:transposase InsO family protein